LTDAETTRLLERLAGSVPDHAAPVASLLEDARRARRRRSTLVASAASVVAVVLVATGLSLSSHDSTTATAAAPVPAPGMTFVGIRDLVVEVPASWVRFQPECGYPTTPYVYFLPVAVHGCIPEPENPPPPQPAIGIGDTDHVGSGCGTTGGGPGRCTEVVGTEPGVGFVLEYAWHDASQAAVAAAIADSLRRLPEGWTTVPYVDEYRGGRTVDEAVRTIEDAGLTVGESPSRGRVARTGPTAGSVVADGSVVDLVGEGQVDEYAYTHCVVTLTADGATQELRLSHPGQVVQLSGPGRVDVIVGSECPRDLGVATAVVTGDDTAVGERTSTSLEVAAGDTHVVLVYSGCPETAPGCRGPQVLRKYPISFG
jgi:hypothetical protein